MSTPWSSAVRLRRSPNKPSPDSLSTRDGRAVPIFDSEAADPVAYLATIFDVLPGSPRRKDSTER